MPEQEFGSEPTVSKDSTDTAHCSTVPTEPRQPYQESASASDHTADDSLNPLDLSPSPEGAEQIEKVRALLRATIEPLHTSLQSAVKRLLAPSLSVQDAVRRMLAPSQAMLAGAHFRLLESVAETARARTEIMDTLTRAVQVETALSLPCLTSVEGSLLRTEHLVRQMTPVAKRAQIETVSNITRMLGKTEMARRLLVERLTLTSLGITAVAEQAALRLLREVTLHAVELARASLEHLRHLDSLAFATARIHEMLVSVARAAASSLRRSIWQDLDPRIWWRLELRFMLSAVEEGHPEALEFTFRRLGIRNPRPEHVVALRRVLRQRAVWEVSQRQHPLPYLRTAVWREAKRVARDIKVDDKELWRPNPKLGIEVLPLDAVLDDEGKVVLADTLPADPLLTGAPPTAWDPVAALEAAEDREFVAWIASQLTPEERRVWMLYALADFTRREAVRAVFPGLDGPSADGKWKALQKRLRNAVEGRTRRSRRR
ncbi:hypothetical protein Tmar_1912 [Thermaerobacter marianensis DSM 12885]|uniref:Uncharacterized protein n=1 Tax=Thermaerobacter marianensis (strain ATCC 700841 / DSM 12885 / JCM 10246 / 7p75a) TaxID=644966 RepID=E6SIQ4_THEM7|nr:hypothetical protein [Thermaerobacter marianensis]ADU51998.1 hypothetical protein Tmar_1912 [Thermaerobacter marianensis DSM 12885]